MYYFIKDLADRLLAGALLILTLPALALIALCLVGKEGVIFKQQRVGYKGRLFWIYKFRTMRTAFDAQGEPLPDAERVTRVGKFLRKTSLDELPQFLNILRGEMSFVGPRPLLLEYLPLYDSRQAKRHEVRQGLTGWAQIHGRNALDWHSRLELDAEYVTKASFMLDVYILAKTFLLLFSKNKGDILIEKFKGKNT
jgi:sugar transferase EpsL